MRRVYVAMCVHVLTGYYYYYYSSSRLSCVGISYASATANAAAVVQPLLRTTTTTSRITDSACQHAVCLPVRNPNKQRCCCCSCYYLCRVRCEHCHSACCVLCVMPVVAFPCAFCVIIIIIVVVVSLRQHVVPVSFPANAHAHSTTSYR